MSSTHSSHGSMASFQSRGIAALASRLRLRRDEQPRALWQRIVIALLLLGILCVIAWPFTRAHLQAIAVLDLVSNEAVPPALRALVGDAIVVREVTLSTAHGPVRARFFTPQNHPHAPALLLLHGVHHLGMNEPRLVTFASAMAACGISVLTPELPDIRDYHVGANSIATIGDSASWLVAENGGKPVGVMGLSFSGGLSLLAAADPKYRPSIRFVVAIGSQDEMARVAKFYRTGEDERPNGTAEMLPPHEYGALVMEYEHLEDFVPASDIEPLRAVLRAHLYEDLEGEKAALATLNLRQQSEAKQLKDVSSPETRDALARAEAKHVADMAGVSPHGHIGQLTTPVYLLHGEGDNIIPSAETQWMEDELPSQTLQAALISPVLSHLDLDGKAPGVWDRLRLVHFFALILHAAEKP